MVTMVHNERRRTGRHLSTWLQAAGLVYAIGFGMALVGAAVELVGRGAISLVSWIAGFM
jgi:hypothetical protein